MNIMEYLEERFGIGKENFSDFNIYLGKKEKCYLGPKNVIEKPEIISPGMLMARSLKPTTNLLQMFGHKATKNLITLSKEQAVSYVKGEDLRIGNPGADDGYVIVKYGDYVLGCGFLKGELLSNNIPKAKRLEVKYL